MSAEAQYYVISMDEEEEEDKDTQNCHRRNWKSPFDKFRLERKSCAEHEDGDKDCDDSGHRHSPDLDEKKKFHNMLPDVIKKLLNQDKEATRTEHWPFKSPRSRVSIGSSCGHESGGSDEASDISIDDSVDSNSQGDSANAIRGSNCSIISNEKINSPGEGENEDSIHSLDDTCSSRHNLLPSSEKPTSRKRTKSKTSSEANAHEEIEILSAVSSVHCRICQLNENETDETLIETTCHCKGSLKLAHQSCVDTWMKTKRSTSCEICKGQLGDIIPDTEEEEEEEVEPESWLDRVTNRVLINMGVTEAQLTPQELNQIRRLVGRQMQKSVLSVIVCVLTVCIVVTCYVVVVTSYLTVGLPLLAVFVFLTLLTKEKLDQLIAAEMNDG